MTAVMGQKPLFSPGDSAVLAKLFSPEETVNELPIRVDSNLQNDPAILDIELLSKLRREEAFWIQNIEKTYPHESSQISCKSDESVLDRAIIAFQGIIEKYPKYASAYINHAQALRLKYGDSLIHMRSAQAAQNILSDLEQAISICSPHSRTSPISPIPARMLANAHTLRGTMLHRASKDSRILKQNPNHKYKMLTSLTNHSPEELEEMGNRDFFLGGQYGNSMAKVMAVHTNPYAKLCGAIVQEAMRKEHGSL